MALTAEEINVVLRARDEASHVVNNVSKSLGFLGQAAAGPHNAIVGLTSVLGKIGLAGMGIQAIQGAMQGLGKALGVDFNAAMEQNKIAFTTMLGSADASNKMLADLQIMAAKTPFEFPDLVTGTKRLLAFGFEADKVLPMLRTIGDAASGLGLTGAEGISRIGRALGQMKAKGKVSAEEMMQLSEIGINGWQMIADGMHKSTAEVQKLSEKGLIPAEAAIQHLLAGMGKQFPDMMEKQSTSYAGMMSTLHDTMAMTAAKMGVPIFEAMKGTLQQVLAVLGDPQVEAAIDAMANTVANGIRSIQGFFSDLRGHAATVFEILRGMFERGGAAFAGMAQRMGPAGAALGGVFSGITGILEGLVFLMQGNFVGAMQSVSGVMGNFSGAAGNVQQAMADLGAKLQPVFQFIRDNAVPILGAIAGVIAALVLPSIMAFIAVIPAVVAGLGAIAVGVLAALWPLALMAAAGALLAKAWSENWGDIQGKTKAALDFVWQKIQSVLSVVVPFFMGQFGRIIGWFQENWPLIERTARNVADKLIGVMEFVTQAIKTIWEKVGPYILPIISIVWDQIKNIIETVIHVVLGIITTVMHLINGEWEEAWNSLLDVLDTVWGFIQKTVENSIALVLAVVAGLAVSIVALTGEFFNAGGTLARNVIDGFVDAISGGDPETKKSIERFAEGVVWTAKMGLGIHSPSTIFQAMGDDVIEGFIRGVDRRQDAVVDSMNRMMSATKLAVRQGIGELMGELDGVAPAMAAMLNRDIGGAGVGRFNEVLGAMQGQSGQVSAIREQQQRVRDQEALVIQSEMRIASIRDQMAAIDIENQRRQLENQGLLLEYRRQDIELVQRSRPLRDQVAQIDAQISSVGRGNVGLMRQQLELAQQILPHKQALAAIEQQIAGIGNKRLSLDQQEAILLEQQKELPIRERLAAMDLLIRAEQDRFDANIGMSDLAKQKGQEALDRMARERKAIENELRPFEDKIDAIKREQNAVSIVDQLSRIRLEREKLNIVENTGKIQDQVTAVQNQQDVEAARNALAVFALEQQKVGLLAEIGLIDEQRAAISLATDQIREQMELQGMAGEVTKLALQGALINEELWHTEQKSHLTTMQQVHAELVQGFIEALTASKTFTQVEAEEVAKRLGLWDGEMSKVRALAQEIRSLPAPGSGGGGGGGESGGGEVTPSNVGALISTIANSGNPAGAVAAIAAQIGATASQTAAAILNSGTQQWVDWQTQNGVGGSGPNIPMAGGGAGVTRGPTLFLAGERGPEPFFFGDQAAGGGSVPELNLRGDVYLDGRVVGEVSWEYIKSRKTDGAALGFT